jgi:hypothetical protein
MPGNGQPAGHRQRRQSRTKRTENQLRQGLHPTEKTDAQSRQVFVLAECRQALKEKVSWFLDKY